MDQREIARHTSLVCDHALRRRRSFPGGVVGPQGLFDRGERVGRENWLFAGSQFGGETAAAWSSVIGSALLHEVEPWSYLSDVLIRMPRLRSEPADTDLEPRLPERWIAEHPETRLALNR